MLPPSNRALATSWSPLLWLVLFLYSALALLYAAATPLFEKPDENWHFAFAMYLVETGRLPVQRLGPRDHLAEQEGSQPPLYYALLAGGLRLAGLDRLSEGYATLTEINPYYGGRPGAWRDNANQFVRPPCDTPCQRTATAVYLGRGLSILSGLLALGAAAAALALAFPDWPALRLGTIGMMAFNPQFLHISSSVSNDALTVALVNVAFALALWWLRQPTDARRVAALALAVALATLTKPSALSIVVTMGLLLLVGGKLPWRARLHALLLYGTTFGGVSGWWFVRNQLLYGEPTATQIHLQVYGLKAEPLAWPTLIAEWKMVTNSFWASFGWGAINPPQSAYATVQGLALLLALAAGLALWRGWRSWNEGQRALVALALFQTFLVGLLLFRWMRLTVAPLGRLLFPALLPLSLLLTLGLLRLLPRRVERPALLAYLGGWATACLLCLLLLIRPAYAPSPALAALPSGATPLAVRFGDEMILAGYKAPTEPLAPGDPVPITLYWRPLRVPSDQFSIAVKLFGRGGALLAESNSYPDGGRTPTRTWQADSVGRLIPDRATLQLAPDAATPTLAHVEIDVFLRDAALTRLPATVAGQPVRPLRPFRLLVRQTSPAPAPSGDFLFRPRLDALALQGSKLDAYLTWEVGQPLAGDYQAFFHLAPAADQPPVVTADFPPLGNDLPTSLWQAGDRLADRASLDLPAPSRPGDYLLLVGLYDRATQQRIAGDAGRTVWALARLRWDGVTWRWQPARPN